MSQGAGKPTPLPYTGTDRLSRRVGASACPRP